MVECDGVVHNPELKVRWYDLTATDLKGTMEELELRMRIQMQRFDKKKEEFPGRAWAGLWKPDLWTLFLGMSSLAKELCRLVVSHDFFQFGAFTFIVTRLEREWLLSQCAAVGQRMEG
ncbi:hypothetical protein FGB62_376g08 [Gracilaria domingensis]|nr:hypothetical protein FGB62_376g08 [Gracilaria domingensis]